MAERLLSSQPMLVDSLAVVAAHLAACLLTPLGPDQVTLLDKMCNTLIQDNVAVELLRWGMRAWQHAVSCAKCPPSLPAPSRPPFAAAALPRLLPCAQGDRV